MAFNFRPVEREQQFLMPPSIAEWLPDDHLAWFVIDVVDELDLWSDPDFADTSGLASSSVA